MNQIALSETYKECLPEIKRIVHYFHKRGGGDISEMLSTADMVFVICYLKYDYEYGVPFDFYLKFKLSNQLKSELRKRLRREKLLPTSNGDDLEEVEARPPGFDLGEFILSLSRDAQIAIRLVFIPTRKENDFRKIRSAVRKGLRKLGWTHKRIDQTFHEIRSKL